VNIVHIANMVHKEMHNESPRERRRARKLAEILDAAEELLLEGGPEAMTIRAVALRVDLAVGAIYRYFPSKEAMLAGVGARMVHALSADLNEGQAQTAKVRSLHGEEIAALFSLQWIASSYYERCLESYELYQLANLMLVDQRKLLDPDQRSGLMDDVFQFLGEVANLVTHAGDVGAIKVQNPMDQALILWSSLNGILQLKKLGREDAVIVKPDLLQKQVVHTLLLGWGANQEKLESAWDQLNQGA